MRRTQSLQVVGPCALFAAILAAEGAAYALAHVPTSGFLWYMNLRWFAAFQSSHYVLSDLFDIDYFQLFFVGIPLIAMACVGLWAKRPFLLALGSNLSFAYTAFLGLLGACLISFVVSHVVYLRAVRAHG
jgi:hypothetical protein